MTPGRLIFRVPGDIPRMNPPLLNDLDRAAAALGFDLGATTAITGHDPLTASGNPSRHMKGEAVDLSILGGATIENAPQHFNERANALVAYLVGTLGYVHTPNETGHDKVCIFGTEGHFNHVHVSNRTGRG